MDDAIHVVYFNGNGGLTDEPRRVAHSQAVLLLKRTRHNTTNMFCMPLPCLHFSSKGGFMR